MSEIVPLPRDRIDDKRSVNLEYEPRAFPRQRFAIRLDFNDVLERWVVDIEHLDRDMRITRSVVTPYRSYPYLPWIVFIFLDPSGEAKSVTPENLGETVNLYVLAGPEGREDGEGS